MSELEPLSAPTEQDLLISQLEDELYRLTALLNASALVAGSLDVDTVLQMLVEQAAQVLRAEGASLLLVDEVADELVFRVAHGEKGAELVGRRFPRDRGIAGAVATTCEPLRITDAREDPRHLQQFDNELKFVTGSVMAVPVQARGEVLGVLEVLNPSSAGAFTEEDLSLLVAFATQTALTLTNAREFSGVQRKLALVVNSMQDGLIVLDRDGAVELLNPAARTMLGLGEGPLPTRDRLAGIAGDPHAFTPVESAVEYHLGLEPGGTGARAVQVRASPLHDPAGAQMGTVLVLHDVSRAHDLERLKNELIATVSHEVRTPVASIQGSAQLLADGTVAAASEEGERFLEIIQRNATRLAKLVTSIVDLAQLGSSSLEVSPGDCALRAVLDEAVAAAQPAIAEAGQTLTLEVAADCPHVWADARRVKQVLGHLLDNARKFAPEGSAIVVSATADAECATVRVRDAGPGLGAEEREHAFEIFRQLSDPHRAKADGAGIGLPIARGVIEALGGRMWIEPRPAGAGTEIAFTLPRTAPHP